MCFSRIITNQKMFKKIAAPDKNIYMKKKVLLELFGKLGRIFVL